MEIWDSYTKNGGNINIQNAEITCQIAQFVFKFVPSI